MRRLNATTEDTVRVGVRISASDIPCVDDIS